jgi:DNA-binding beta-propeller fold protein YncE
MSKLLPTFLLIGTTAASAQFVPRATDLPSHPFFIKQTWIIGGHGDWDYLTMDTTANRLYIAHGAEVQVVDVETGNLAGSVKGFREAHSVALDGAGESGYVSDGAANEVKIFDRRSLEVTAKISLDSSPRALVFEPETGLLLAVSAGPAGAPPPDADPKVLRQWANQQWLKAQQEAAAARPGSRPSEPVRNPCSRYTGPGPVPAWESLLTLIDPEAKAVIAEVNVCGYAGHAVADGSGRVFTAFVNDDEILRVDTASVLNLAKAASQPKPPDLRPMYGSYSGGVLHLDWRTAGPYGPRGASRMFPSSSDFETMSLGPDCHQPRALAVDARDNRIFAACSNLKMAVLNSGTGAVVATLPIGPGPDAVGYDPDPASSLPPTAARRAASPSSAATRLTATTWCRRCPRASRRGPWPSTPPLAKSTWSP